MRTMTLDQIRTVTPSVFAEQPWHTMSEKYRFFPTSHVVEGLMAQGFLPVRAQQSRTRIEGKRHFTKHMLRFRHASQAESAVQSVIPEIVLVNSHDGSSVYQQHLANLRRKDRLPRLRNALSVWRYDRLFCFELCGFCS